MELFWISSLSLEAGNAVDRKAKIFMAYVYLCVNKKYSIKKMKLLISFPFSDTVRYDIFSVLEHVFCTTCCNSFRLYIFPF